MVLFDDEFIFSLINPMGSVMLCMDETFFPILFG